MDRNCIFCTHFYFDSGYPAYSEMTPGMDMIIECTLNKWEIDECVTTDYQFREFLTKARDCSHFRAGVEAQILGFEDD